MPLCFVLINTEPDQMERVLEKLKKIDGVEEVHMLYGVYDIIAKVKADTMDKLKEIVAWHVRSVDKVRSTLTTIVIEETK
jgi:DNA-binding Lrp family transcriptional regulator